jgi:hypothetical protein
MHQQLNSMVGMDRNHENTILSSISITSLPRKRLHKESLKFADQGSSEESFEPTNESSFNIKISGACAI